MIKSYLTGQQFYEENKDLFAKNLHTEVFFRLDAEGLKETNKQEYAIAVIEGDKKLCIIRKLPFPGIATGDIELTEQLANYMADNDYEIGYFSAPIEVGMEFVKHYAKHGINFEPKVKMDYMKCIKPNFPVDERVSKATVNDSKEIYDLMLIFCAECGVPNSETFEMVSNDVLRYRVIRDNNKIIAMAKICESSQYDNRISDVYTNPAYRCKHLARGLVSTCVHEINAEGKYATLSVDQANPISNHVYSSIGFAKTFSQAFFDIVK